MMRIGRYSGRDVSRELFRAYRESGIELIEISIGNKREIHDSLPLADVKAWGEEFGVELWSYHLPFGHYNIAHPDALRREETLDLYDTIIRRAREIGIRYFVVHPSGEPNPPETRAERIEYCKESLAHLAKVARENDAVIAVEDLPRTCLGNCSSELLDLLGADDSLRVCFDTNHLLGEDIVAFIRNIGKRIVTTHISDYDFIDERHWLPGEGKVDWQALYQALLEVGYEGPWLYEVGFDTPVKTLTRPRNLVCADYVRNAREIFDGKPLTVIGTPLPGLGMNVW